LFFDDYGVLILCLNNAAALNKSSSALFDAIVRASFT